MNPRVKSVIALENHELEIEFVNREKRIFDMKPFLNIGVFKELQDVAYFKTVRVAYGTVEWPHEQDLCPDTLYEDSKPLKGSAGKE